MTREQRNLLLELLGVFFITCAAILIAITPLTPEFPAHASVPSTQFLHASFADQMLPEDWKPVTLERVSFRTASTSALSITSFEQVSILDKSFDDGQYARCALDLDGKEQASLRESWVHGDVIDVDLTTTATITSGLHTFALVCQNVTSQAIWKSGGTTVLIQTI